MRPPVKVPELLEAIAAHARAVLAGDVGAAEGYVAPLALEAYRLAINEAMSRKAIRSSHGAGPRAARLPLHLQGALRERTRERADANPVGARRRGPLEDRRG